MASANFCVVMKVFCKIILDRARGSFWQDPLKINKLASCSDQINNLRIIVEQSIEFRCPLYLLLEEEPGVKWVSIVSNLVKNHLLTMLTIQYQFHKYPDAHLVLLFQNNIQYLFEEFCKFSFHLMVSFSNQNHWESNTTTTRKTHLINKLTNIHQACSRRKEHKKCVENLCKFEFYFYETQELEQHTHMLLHSIH